MAAKGKKRLRPLPDTSFYEDDEPNSRSNKFIKLRQRTRAPIRTGRININTNASGNSNNSNLTATSSSSVGGSNSNIYTTASSNSSGVSSSNSSQAGVRNTFHKQGDAKAERFTGKMKTSPNKPKPFFSFGRDDGDRNASRNSKPNRGQNNRKSGPPKPYKKKRPGATSTPLRKGPVPSVPYGEDTPEFMRIKEDESILIEKKERKRKRNKIMHMKTSKGQPLMRGRIELLLDEIKATTQKN